MALVVLTNDEEKIVTILRKFELHVWSILPLSTSSTLLRTVVIAVTCGLITCPAYSLDQLLKRKVVGAEPLSLVSSSITEPFTSRELDVLDLIGQGLSNKLLARSLHISDQTVKFHISSITTKLGASSCTDAVSIGLHKGFITL